MKETILTGLRTNDEYHIGNYLGAMRPIIDMATKHAGEYTVNMFIPDLHSFTTPIDHATFYERSLRNLRVFFAAGLPLDSESVHVYRQSYVSAHAELTIILNNFAPYGQLSRMVEFKEKKERFDEEFVSVGLFDYPVLMAADILLYDAKYVPLGDDQRQHIELARDLAERFNNKFGDIFILPATIKEQAKFVGAEEPLRVMSLQDPTRKMSKSVSDPNGTIMIFDDPVSARKKVLSAVTDSIGLINFDRANQPGITNLLTMLSVLSGKSQVNVNNEFVGQSQYGALKTAVADEVEALLTRLQTTFDELDVAQIMQKLEKDELYANEISHKKLMAVQKAVGLRSDE
jgi:tryptophanyl-tRNA synthetase